MLLFIDQKGNPPIIFSVTHIVSIHSKNPPMTAQKIWLSHFFRVKLGWANSPNSPRNQLSTWSTNRVVLIGSLYYPPTQEKEVLRWTQGSPMALGKCIYSMNSQSLILADLDLLVVHHGDIIEELDVGPSWPQYPPKPSSDKEV